VCGVGQQVFDAAGQPCQRQVEVGRDVVVCDREGAVGRQVGEGEGLGVVGLGEGVGQRGAAVVDAVVDALRAVEMAQGGVVDAVEEVGA
jgi:hypothetical protein